MKSNITPYHDNKILRLCVGYLQFLFRRILCNVNHVVYGKWQFSQVQTILYTYYYFLTPSLVLQKTSPFPQRQ